MLVLLSIVHLCALLFLTDRAMRRLFSGFLTRCVGTFIVSWVNLVYTALSLALLTQLNNLTLYFVVSMSLAGGFLYAVLRLGDGVTPLALFDDSTKEPLNKMQRAVTVLLSVTLLLAALGTLIICLRYFANNWDTLAYRFSRVFFYLAKGSLLHFVQGFDPRAIYYPFNAALGYIFPAIYELDGRLFNLPSLFCWIASGCGVFVLSRVLGASRFGSFVAAWLCLMAPVVLCVASSTNDEILAAAPTVCGMVFVVRALLQWSRRCAVLGLVGLGLGFGVKLHWGFFAPFVLIAAAVCLFLVVRSPGILKLWKSRIPEIAAGALLAMPLIVSFAICNLVSTSQLADPSQVKDAVNSPFRVDVAAQKIKINSAQLFLSPIPDLLVTFDAEARKAAYTGFNQWTNERWFKNVNRDAAFRVIPYDFQGIADPTGYLHFEQTVWLGFLPVFLLMVVVVGLVRRDSPLLAVAICSLFFLWHMSYSAQTKYAEAVGTYYSYPAILACGGLGLVVDRLSWRDSILGKLFLLSLSGVIITHIILDFNLLTFNMQRSVPVALSKGFDGETVVTRTSPRVMEAVRKHDRIHVPYTHWELLFWNFMRHNPHARYTTGPAPLPGGADPLFLLSLGGSADAGKLVGRRPGGRSKGIVYLGTTYSGVENVFAYGAGVENEYPDAANYFLIPASITLKPGSQSIGRIRIDTLGVVGLKTDDEVEFRVVAEFQDGSRRAGQWLRAAGVSDDMELDPGKTATSLAVEARITESPSQVCTLTNAVQAAIRPEQSACAINAAESELRIVLPTNTPQQEPTQWSGRDYLVRWLGQRTEFTVINGGKAAKAEIRLQLGINKKAKMIRIQYGNTKSEAVKVDKLLWAAGPQAYTFPVYLQPGANKMVLSSEEPADPLPDGRPAAVLLIGNMTAFSGAAPVIVVYKHTSMNCYCGSTEASATSAYRSMQTDGGKAVAGLFEKKQLFELEKNAPLQPVSKAGSYSKVDVKGGRHAGTTCWLPTSLIE